MKAPEEIIKKLQDYFAKRDDVVLAYLFGSQAEGTATPGRSDYDIAVYFSPKSGIFEYEADTGIYPHEADVNAELGQITETEVDLVVLNRAPADIVFTAINDTIMLAEKDHDLRMRLLLQSSFDAEVYRDMVHEFAAIAARSKSLSEKDRLDLAKMITFLRSEIIETFEAGKIDQRTFELDRGKRKILEKSVENLGVVAIDIAKILLASHRRNIPPKYTDVMRDLRLLDGFSQEVAEWLSRGIKLRNYVAHEYLDLEFAWLQNFVQGIEKNYSYLIAFTSSYMESEKSRPQS